MVLQLAAAKKTENQEVQVAVAPILQPVVDQAVLELQDKELMEDLLGLLVPLRWLLEEGGHQQQELVAHLLPEDQVVQDYSQTFLVLLFEERAVVVEECWPQCGIGAEVVANLCDRVFFDLDAPIARVSGEEVPAPYARELEQSCIPDVAKIVAAAKRTQC